ncbi:porin [Herbaspirillum seropedicae]|uniref:porin n=1 Tax=Herbaspirillum seropedicae TaxID=964 RepID=UPI00111DC299|nr:porin [Herbaspirillum seropedicae]QDD63762.1 porin [Herbaspirillum seropedicae]
MKALKGLKAIIAALLTMSATLSQAQSVTLYGIIDTGVEYVSNVGAGQQGLLRVPNLTATTPSRIGLRGSEDLGGGLRSVFMLESGFAPDSGALNQGGRMFGRIAYVGLSDHWGQVSFGRQATMLLWATLDSDILGANVYGANALDNYRPNARADNSIAYRGSFGAFTLGGTYSFGRDTVNAGQNPAGTNCAGEQAGDSLACREWSLMVKYDTAAWGASLAYDTLRGGKGAAAGLSSSQLSDSRMLLGAYLKAERLKVGIGGSLRHNQGSALSKSQLYYAGLSYDLTPSLNLAGQLYYLHYDDSANKAWLGALRATYSLSARTALYLTSGFIDNRGQSNLSVSAGGSVGTANPAPGGNQFGMMAGIRHSF